MSVVRLLWWRRCSMLLLIVGFTYWHLGTTHYWEKHTCLGNALLLLPFQKLHHGNIYTTLDSRRLWLNLPYDPYLAQHRILAFHVRVFMGNLLCVACLIQLLSILYHWLPGLSLGESRLLRRSSHG